MPALSPRTFQLRWRGDEIPRWAMGFAELISELEATGRVQIILDGDGDGTVIATTTDLAIAAEYRFVEVTKEEPVQERKKVSEQDDQRRHLLVQKDLGQPFTVG